MMLQRFRFLAAVFAIAACVMVGQVNADVISVQIGVGGDEETNDAEESLGPAATLPGSGSANSASVVGAISLSSSDLELGSDFRVQGGETAEWRQLIGLRFPDVAIPIGATINSASVRFTVDELGKGSGTPSFTIYGELSSSPATFVATPFNISDRPDTTATVSWNSVPEWTPVGDSGAAQTTTDLSTIVQEIVDQGGWGSGNALAIFIEPGAGNDFARVAEDGDTPGQGAVLTVDFTPIPEPASLLLASLAAMIGFVGRRR